MRLRWLGRIAAAFVAVGLTLSVASADSPTVQLKAKLAGFTEVPANLTTGAGTFTATIQGGSLTYHLTYSGLSGPATQAHIHFAQPNVNGGVFLFLCGSATNPGPAGTPLCPGAGGTVTRTVTAADFLALPGQGLAAGDFAGAMKILESRVAYANVHSAKFPGGEIRGNVRSEEEGSD
jgi:hypothetical protein